jgi:K+-transporting ATPase KdpF subunit
MAQGFLGSVPAYLPEPNGGAPSNRNILRNLYTPTSGLVSILKSGRLTFTLSQTTEKLNGLHLSHRHGSLCRPRRRPRQGVRATGGSAAMSWLTLVAGLAAAGLFIYLVAAMLKPEDFS